MSGQQFDAAGQVSGPPTFQRTRKTAMQIPTPAFQQRLACDILHQRVLEAKFEIGHHACVVDEPGALKTVEMYLEIRPLPSGEFLQE